MLDSLLKYIKQKLGGPKLETIPGLDDKTSLILVLIKMAQADGHVNHFENMYIYMLSNTLGVDGAKVSALKSKLDIVDIVPPETRRQKIDYFWRILSMMKMDLHAHEKELEMSLDLGTSLGFSKKESNICIDYMCANMNKVVGFDDFSAQLDV
jgi:hypothetical protein